MATSHQTWKKTIFFARRILQPNLPEQNVTTKIAELFANSPKKNSKVVKITK